MNQLEKAIILATEAHAGQTTKDGLPYIIHPLHLMTHMETESEMIVAVLHDVVEDTAISLEDLAAVGFSDAVLAAVSLLTHDDPDVAYDEYVAALKHNLLARKVKLADLTHNMDVRRLPAVGEREAKRLKRYRQAWEMLTS